MREKYIFTITNTTDFNKGKILQFFKIEKHIKIHKDRNTNYFYSYWKYIIYIPCKLLLLLLWRTYYCFQYILTYYLYQMQSTIISNIENIIN